jgi:hypothetical protein
MKMPPPPPAPSCCESNQLPVNLSTPSLLTRYSQWRIAAQSYVRIVTSRQATAWSTTFQTSPLLNDKAEECLDYCWYAYFIHWAHQCSIDGYFLNQTFCNRTQSVYVRNSRRQSVLHAWGNREQTAHHIWGNPRKSVFHVWGNWIQRP